jgi:hypothetical protein
LTAGALLAHAGTGVLAVEADQKPSGYAHALCRAGYTFDRAGNLITSCGQQGPFGQGVIDTVVRELVRVINASSFGSMILLRRSVPRLLAGGAMRREPFLEAHLRHFPR